MSCPECGQEPSGSGDRSSPPCHCVVACGCEDSKCHYRAHGWEASKNKDEKGNPVTYYWKPASTRCRTSKEGAKKASSNTVVVAQPCSNAGLPPPIGFMPSTMMTTPAFLPPTVRPSSSCPVSFFPPPTSSSTRVWGQPASMPMPAQPAMQRQEQQQQYQPALSPPSWQSIQDQQSPLGYYSSYGITSSTRRPTVDVPDSSGGGRFSGANSDGDGDTGASHGPSCSGDAMSMIPLFPAHSAPYHQPFASAASLVLPPATCHDAQPFVTVGSTSTPPLVHDNMDWLSTPTLISRVQNHWIDEDGAAALLVEVQGPANGRFAIVGVVQAELQPGDCTGKVEVIGVKDDILTSEGVTIATSYLRSHGTELCNTLQPSIPGTAEVIDIHDHLEDSLRHDVMLRLLPAETIRVGPSASVAFFLALLRLHLKVRLVPKVATSGVLTMSGLIGAIGGVVTKVKGACRFGVEKVVLSRDNEGDIKKALEGNVLTEEEVAMVRYVRNVLELLREVIEGFKETETADQLTRFDHSRSPTGSFHALLVQKYLSPPSLTCHVLGLSEASALLCLDGQAGQVITTGIGQDGCQASSAIKDATYFLKKYHLTQPIKVLDQLLGTPSFIDYERLVNHQGMPVDILFHIPPHHNAAFLGPSMVLALIAMLWRLPPLTTCSAVGGFDIHYNLEPYPSLDTSYVDNALSRGLRTLLVPLKNEEEIRTDMATRSETPEGKGVVLKGFATMMGMVEYVIEEGWKKALAGQVEEEEDEQEGGGEEEMKGSG